MKKMMIMVALVAALGGAVAATQAKAGYLDEEATITVYGDAKPGKTYPLIVFLPWTGGTADESFEAFSSATGLDTFVALKPAGRTASGDYLPDFISYVKWYDARLKLDLARALKDYPVDAKSVFLTGFSLGGDLSWALLVKEKETFAGALILGSRCSWTATAADLRYLKQNGKRVVFLIGNKDQAARRDGMKAAYAAVKKAGIVTGYKEFDAQHDIAPVEMLENAFDLLFGRKNALN